MAQATKKQNQDPFDLAVRQINEVRQSHAMFRQKVEARYKSYRGFVTEVQDDWRSQAHPPYIQHIVETTLASLMVDKFRYRVKPRLTMDTYMDPTAAERARDGATAHQILTDWQVKQDHLTRIQRPFNLQHAIAGITVAKTYWTTREERRSSLVSKNVPLLDDTGAHMMDPVTGTGIHYPTLDQVEKLHVVYDGPTTEVRDVRDFMWPENAVSLEKSGFVVDRVWLRKDELAEAWREGQFGSHVGGWDWQTAAELLGARDRDSGTSTNEEAVSREQELYKANRTKDLYEVCEVWNQMNGMMTTVVNRKVLAAYVPFPFWHNRPPFTVCSTQPDLFRMNGISQVEKVEHLQKLLWELMNQRIDNLKLINNAIFFFRPDLEDADDLEFEPGARWVVEDPAQVNMWQPNVIPAEVSLQGEGLLKGDMQNLAGGFPFSSGTDSQNVDQKTATGAALISNIAQRSIDIGKTFVTDAMEDIGHQRMVLNQQFLREPTFASSVGINDEDVLHVIYPEVLQGDYNVTLEADSDPMMKQEEQASANALLQVLSSIAPILMPLAQAGMAKMPNFDALLEDTLRAYGKDDVERYFIQGAPPSLPSQPGQQQGDQSDGQAPAGVTAPQSIDPAVSPSSAQSLSPSSLTHRALAMANGGGRNTGS